MEYDDLEYVGFWPRTGATLIDSILVGIVVFPLLTAFYGESYWDSTSLIVGPMDFLLSWVFPAIAVILFWISKQATPGKMAVSAKIVDAKTGNAASTGQLIGRYLAYYLSLIPLGLGYFGWPLMPANRGGMTSSQAQWSCGRSTGHRNLFRLTPDKQIVDFPRSTRHS